MDCVRTASCGDGFGEETTTDSKLLISMPPTRPAGQEILRTMGAIEPERKDHCARTQASCLCHGHRTADTLGARL
jgi:hypothetical protein